MRKNGIIGFFIIAGFTFFSVPPTAQGEEDISGNAIENQKCLQCHGKQFYSYYNDWVEPGC
ncbi:MAG: hypothetical protein B6I19_11635 [Bacteroidetes bacterium 4572_114]|nr:MAG: hypothetical protein B6I19_11635 [Bacteroidetes bacterium 4572_114]